MVKFHIKLILLVLFLGACNHQRNPIDMNNTTTIDQKVEALLSKMTLEEKVGQMNQYNGFWDVTGPAPQKGDAADKYEDLRKGRVGSMLNVRGVEQVMAVQKVAVEESRLGIPLIIGYDGIHGYKTLSPIPLAEAASWDMDAIRRSAEVAAAEAAAAGINWTFAPMVDISRDARWGRVMEGGGEDPFLGSEIAKARVHGFQGDDLSAIHTIAACAKHFAAYGWAEGGRDYNTVDISETVLRNQVFPPFKAAKEAGVKTFMNAFNELNGIPATGSAQLQRDILKKEWGFEGFVVSDWESIKEMMAHGYAEDLAQTAEIAVNAGSDMDMESYAYVDHLKQLVEDGKVDEALVDDAVRRILKVKFELGLFDDPYKYCDPEREKAVIGSEEHHAAVLEMAKKSMVLLKNDRDLLPLQKEGQRIALIGPLAAEKNSPLGSWRLAADDHTAVSVLEGIQSLGVSVDHVPGCSLTTGDAHFGFNLAINSTDKSGFENAINAARNADRVVMVLGEHAFQSGEARSRTDLGLPGVQQQLLEEVYKVNQNIVLVLMNGRPLAIEWADENIPAILEAWQLGTQSGNAIAHVLFGDHNPSGKLPMTFPRDVGQVPMYYNHKQTGRPAPPAPNVVFWSHYIDQENSPLYPFGHGLSYTSFEYSDLQLSSDSFGAGSEFTASFQLRNTGSREGTEVVQLYIRDLVGSITRPVKELKGFELVTLAPGESKKVTFTINEETIQFFTARKKWEAEPGDFKVFVGGSSVTTLEGDFRFDG